MRDFLQFSLTNNCRNRQLCVFEFTFISGLLLHAHVCPLGGGSVPPHIVVRFIHLILPCDRNNYRFAFVALHFLLIIIGCQKVCFSAVLIHFNKVN